MSDELFRFSLTNFIFPILTGIISGWIVYKIEERKNNKLKNNLKNLVKIEMTKNIEYLERLKKEVSSNKNVIYGFPIKISTINLKDTITNNPQEFNSKELTKLRHIYDDMELLLNKNLWNHNSNKSYSKFSEIENYNYQNTINNNDEILDLIDNILNEKNFIQSL